MSLRPQLLLLLAILGSAVPLRSGNIEAVLVIAADVHSAYDRFPAFVAHVDRIRAEHPDVPLAILLNGDLQEYGNAVAKRSAGTLDFEFAAALSQRAPTVLNLGNHDADYFSFEESIQRYQASGFVVISGNLRAKRTGQPFVPATAKLRLGAHELTIAGVITDALATFRAEVRPEIEIAEPGAWGKANLPALLADAKLPVILSHAGLRADRDMLPIVPTGALFIGAHDHLRFTHDDGRVDYVHTGHWLSAFAVAKLVRDGERLSWVVQEVPATTTDAADPAMDLAKRRLFDEALTAEDRVIVGHAPRALTSAEAAELAVEAARAATQADVAIIGGSTFGSGLPAGDIRRHEVDAWIRFDGALAATELEGAQLKAMLLRARQGPETPFAERTGDNLVVAGVATADIDPSRRYRLVTTPWILRNPGRYLGVTALRFSEVPDVKLRGAALKKLPKQ